MNAIMEAPPIAPHDPHESELAEPSQTETTLFDLIAALQDAADSNDDATVIAAVAHLSRSGRIRLRAPVSGNN